MTDKEFKKYMSGPFLPTKHGIGSEVTINKYGVLMSSHGNVLKPEKKYPRLRYFIRNKYQSSPVDIYENINRLFGTCKHILTKNQIDAVWSKFHNKPIDYFDHNRGGNKLPKKITRKMSSNEHRCRTKGCEEIITKSKTWCEYCVLARQKDMSPYLGSRISITTNTVTTDMG